MKYFYLYKITNIVNNKIYIGVHTTKNPTDNYMGSGAALSRAKLKYGLCNFKKEILQWFDTADLMYDREREIVTVEFISERSNYNLKVGGIGGSVKGIKRTIAQNAARKLFMIGKNSGKTHTQDVVDKRKVCMFGNTFALGKIHTLEQNAIKSARMKGIPKPKVVCPHCSKIGGRPQMLRHHFNNCKLKVINE